MIEYKFIDNYGTFTLSHPEDTGYLYFPIAGSQGIKSSITPELKGDCKLNQNHFLLQPVTAEDLHDRKGSRNFWCVVEGEGVWSCTGVSAQEESKRFAACKEKEKDEKSLTAGLLWHEIKNRSYEFGLTSTIRSFVPEGSEQLEIMEVTIENSSDHETTITPIAAIPMFARSADNIRDHRHVTSLLHRINVLDKAVVVEPILSFDERGHQRNHMSYYVAGMEEQGTAPEEFYPIVEDYIGEGGSFTNPQAVYHMEHGVKTGFRAEGFEAMGGLKFAKTTLNPGQTATYLILLGMFMQQKELVKCLKHYCCKEKVDQEWAKTLESWKKQNNIKYYTADTSFNQFMNWVNIQPILRRIYGCSFLPHHDYGRGGRGWRDLWQDCLALSIMSPDTVKEMLLNNFGGVRIDGTNATIIGEHPGEFKADRNNITRVWMDHGYWPLLTTSLYINQTGDISILLKENSYFHDCQIMRGTKVNSNLPLEQTLRLKDQYARVYYGTVLEHLLIQNLTAFYDVGEHNHMRLRGADWNDALDMASERGESVAFTAAYAGNLKNLAYWIEQLHIEKNMQYVEVAVEMQRLFVFESELYEDVNRKLDLLSEYCEAVSNQILGQKAYIPVEVVISCLLHMAEWIQDHIRKNEWLEDNKNELGWFNSYYDNHGERVERTLSDVRMMLTGQVFTIMSGTATKDQTVSICKSADAYLYDPKIGGYRLNTNFNEMKADLGRMFGFAYGHKENGAVFSHMTTMYGYALYQQGFVKEGYKALYTLYQQCKNFDVSKIYPGIPEYFNERGRGMYHYLTGAASWFLFTVVTQMFGVRGKVGNLILEPKLMAEQFDEEKRAKITFPFAKRKWTVIYINESKKEYGTYAVKKVLLDGKQLKQGCDCVVITQEDIRHLEESMEHEVIVELS